MGPLDGIKAVVYTDTQPLPAELERWRKSGGVVIGPGLSDPYAIAAETHLKLGRKHDLLRLWNAGSMNLHYTESPDGAKRLIHLINYSTRAPASEVTLGLATAFKRARMHTFQYAKDLKPVIPAPAEGSGIELVLPPFSVFAAIEVEN